jgi:hypothetical protein
VEKARAKDGERYKRRRTMKKENVKDKEEIWSGKKYLVFV